MSQPLPSYNPYASPGPGEPQYAPPKRTPGYLTFLCVVSIVLGCLGALRGGCVTVSALTGGREPFQRDRTENMPEDMKEAFRKMETQGKAIDAKYGWFNKSMIVLQGLIGAAMVAGGVQTMQSQGIGVTVLRIAFVATLLVSLIHTIGFVPHMLEMQPMFAEFDAAAAESSDPGIAQLMSGGLKMVMYGGLCGGIAWFVFKLALFGHGFFYLGKPEVQAHLQ